MLRSLKKNLKEKKKQYCQTIERGQNFYTTVTNISATSSKA